MIPNESALSDGCAIPFIVYDAKFGFCLSSEAEQYLSSLGDDRKVGVISIVGKYRTGKSFFVNRVLLDRTESQTGFQVGPTINPCTKVILPHFLPLTLTHFRVCGSGDES